MKKRVIAVIFLLLLPFSYAQWYYDSENVVVNTKITAKTEIIPLASDYFLNYVIVNMTFFPKEFDNQEIIYFQTNPKGERIGDSLKFTWNDPKDKKLEFSLSTDARTTNNFVEVKNKVNFPIQSLPSDVVKYTKATKTIDSDSEGVIRIASEIAKEDDDLYSVVFKVADWTKNNIVYNLSTLNIEASQNASWVLENRQGVCDELTVLFIGMLRSLGVPAKFISGVAFTNSPLFTDSWGSHGWAEVYFPGVGWVPWDVTYGEFGFVDPTHFKYQESTDPDVGSTFYLWQGRNVNLFTEKLDIKTRLIKHGEILKPRIKLEADIFKENIGFGSFNLVEAEIINPNDYYYATEVFLSKPDEVKVIGPIFQSVLLKPKEIKKIYWVLNIERELDEKLLYTMPLEISTFNNLTSRTEFKTSSRDIVYPYSDIESVLKQKEEEKEKTYSANINIKCDTRSEFYVFENKSVECLVKNSGYIFLEDLDVCLGDECFKANIGIGQEKKFVFEIKEKIQGKQKVPLKVNNNLVSKLEFVEFDVLDEPKIEIEGIKVPEIVGFEDNFVFSFLLKKVSYSDPIDVNIKLVNALEKEFNINFLSQDKEFEFDLAGSKLKAGENKFKVLVEFKDKNGNVYNTEADYVINLGGLTLKQRAKVTLYQLGLGIADLDVISLIILLVIAVAAFLVILWITLGPSRKI